jgi:hypothetical protein
MSKLFDWLLLMCWSVIIYYLFKRNGFDTADCVVVTGAFWCFPTWIRKLDKWSES